jgi:signal transduction histidine kinase/ActR/RegA family two-component response regulator
MSSDPDTLLIEMERIRTVFQQAHLTLLVTVVNAVLTASVLVPVVDAGLLAIWTGLITVVSAGRWVIRQVFLRRQPAAEQLRHWARLSILGSLTTGILWGVGVIALCPPIGMYQLFLTFVIGGMCAGSITVNSAHFPTVLAFIVPAGLPLAASFFRSGTLLQSVPALMLVIFAAALSLTSLRAHHAFGERIRLQLALRRQQHALTTANERLRKEIVDRRNAEATLQQAQKMEAIGHLTGGIAHDFNNLLQVVLGNVDLINRLSRNNPRVQNYAAAATLAAQRGARLTDSLLAFARRQSLRAEHVDINAVLQEFQQLLLQALGETIHLTMLYDPNLPACHVDSAHFQSAVLNLVINARDAMPNGGRIAITTGVAVLGREDLLDNHDANPGQFITVSVQDTGAGMNDVVLAKVFEPFFTTKEIGKGSGLGLSQVFGFVRQSGGHIRLRSTPGTGTCATIYLPSPQEPQRDKQVIAATKQNNQAIRLRDVAVLAVEDDPQVLRVISACLSDAGCRVRTAQTAREAMDILRDDEDIRCLLSDVALRGDGSGIELTNMARSLRPDLAVLLITGHSAVSTAEHADAGREFHILRKPFPPEELLERISETISTGVTRHPA